MQINPAARQQVDRWQREALESAWSGYGEDEDDVDEWWPHTFRRRKRPRRRRRDG